MRSAAFAMLAILGACDTVFGLERDGVPIDAANADSAKPDAARGIVTFEVSQPANIGEQQTVHARVLDEPDGMVPWTLSATAGTVAEPSGIAKLDALGAGDIATTWTAPGGPGPVTLTLRALGGEAKVTVDVTSLTVSGYDDAGTTVLQVGGDSIFGAQISVGALGTLQRLGVWTQSTAGGHARLALYTDASGPRAKLAETASIALAANRNDIPVVSPVMLAPGTYWVMVQLEQATSVRFTDTESFISTAFDYPAGFPATFTASFISTTGSRPQVFATQSP